jgi:hypothetical protein
MKTLAQEMAEENDRLNMRFRYLTVMKGRTFTMEEAHALCQQREEELNRLREKYGTTEIS